ncbi:unnamed protein product [Scytosiphon promiscuus]
MRFIVCASLEEQSLVSAITANLERFAGLYKGDKRVVILQIDEIATDPRARYYGPTDEILGLCVQHTPTENTRFGGIDNLEDLSSRLVKGESHIGSEHTVISACALGQRPHHAIPVAAFASCKAPNPNQQMRVLNTVIIVGMNITGTKIEASSSIPKKDIGMHILKAPDTSLVVLHPTFAKILKVWTDRFADVIGPIVLVASDGDAVRRPMLYKFTSSTKPKDFAAFKLIDANTSAGGVVQAFDLKHNCKRARTRDLSKKGVTISAEGLPLNRDSYPELFRWFDRKPKETYSSMFNVDDKCVGID